MYRKYNETIDPIIDNIKNIQVESINSFDDTTSVIFNLLGRKLKIEKTTISIFNEKEKTYYWLYYGTNKILGAYDIVIEGKKLAFLYNKILDLNNDCDYKQYNRFIYELKSKI